MYDGETQNIRFLKIDDGKCEALRIAEFIHLLILNTLCKLKLFIFNLFNLCTKCQTLPPGHTLKLRSQVPLVNVSYNNALAQHNALNAFITVR